MEVKKWVGMSRVMIKEEQKETRKLRGCLEFTRKAEKREP